MAGYHTLMLRTPKRLPQRFNRQVSPATRRIVRHQHRHRRKRLRTELLMQKWQRTLHRWQRKGPALKKALLLMAGVTGVGAVALAVFLLLFSPLLDIREIRVLRTDPRIDIETVQRTLSPLFGRRLMFLSDQEVFPLLAPALRDVVGVEVEKQYPSSLVLTLKLDPVIARVQIDEPPATGTGAVAAGTGKVIPMGDYLTERGIYVRYPPTMVASGGLLPLVRVVDWGVRPKHGDHLFDSAFLTLIEQTETLLTQEFGQGIRERVLYLRAQEYHLQTASYALWFDRKSTLDDQLRRYRIFLATAGKAAATLYVDLRLANRIVYR